MTPPFVGTFCPEVPEASWGRRGVLSQHVAALHEHAAHLDVVVLEEHDLAPELSLGQDHQPADRLLAVAVGRMGLAREQELHRTLLVQEQRPQAGHVGEDQDRALVGGESAGEADGEGVRVEQRLDLPQLVGRQAVAGRLGADPLPHEAHEALLLRAVGGPELLVGHGPDALPELRVEEVVLPVGVEVMAVEAPHLGAHPARGMDAVRDGADRLLGRARKEVAPHGRAHLPVEAAHRVRAGGQADGERRHVEVPVVRPQGKELLRLASDLPHQEVHVPPDEPRVEGFVARGHRGVGGEHGVAARGLQGLVEAVPRAHPLAHALEAEEGHVPLVHVPDRGMDTESGERPHPAHAQHDLLAQAHLPPAHVEDAGDGPIRGIVQGDVGVEHEHRHLSHLRLPHRRLHDPPRQVDGHGEDAAVRGVHREHGQPGEVVVRVDVLLETVGVDGLPEVARTVEQADPHEGHPEVGRRLAVVAREHAQAARVDPERLVDPELHREVGHGPGQGVLRLLEPTRPRAVGVEIADDGLRRPDGTPDRTGGASSARAPR